MLCMTNLIPATPQPDTDTPDAPFVRVVGDKPNGRAVIALDADAIDALLHYLDDIGPLHDLVTNAGSYDLDDATAARVSDVVYRISGPLNKLKGYL